MAKQTKGRKSGLSKAQPRSYSELYGNRDVSAVTSAANTTPARRKTQKEEAPVQRGSDSVDWKKDYSQVIGDLRQLLVISSVLFALMIVLGFVI